MQSWTLLTPPQMDAGDPDPSSAKQTDCKWSWKKGAEVNTLLTLMASRKQKHHGHQLRSASHPSPPITLLGKSGSEKGKVKAKAPNMESSILSAWTHASKLHSQPQGSQCKGHMHRHPACRHLPGGEVDVCMHLQLETSSPISQKLSFRCL